MKINGIDVGHYQYFEQKFNVEISLGFAKDTLEPIYVIGHKDHNQYLHLTKDFTSANDITPETYFTLLIYHIENDPLRKR